MNEKRFILKTDKKRYIIDKKENHRIMDMHKACEVLNRMAKTNEELNMIIHINDELDKEKMEALKEAETEIKLLNGYLVEQGLAEDYIRWKKEVG